MNNNLKKFRKSAGFTLLQLGEQVNRSYNEIYSLENQNHRVPTLFTAYAIANALNKTVYEIWPDNTRAVTQSKTPHTPKLMKLSEELRYFESIGKTLEELSERAEKLEVIAHHIWVEEHLKTTGASISDSISYADKKLKNL